jgi:exonuclease III
VVITTTSKGQGFIDLKRNEELEWLDKAISEKTTEAEKLILMGAINILTKLVD